MSDDKLSWIINEIASEPKGSQIDFQLRNDLPHATQINLLKQLEGMDLIFNIKGGTNDVYRFDVSKKLYDMAKSNTPDLSSTPSLTKVTVSLVKEGLFLYIVTPNDKLKLCKFRPETPAERIFANLMFYPDKVLSLGNLKNEVGHLAGVSNLSEVARKAGFTPELKELFLPVCSKSELQIRPSVEISEKQLASIVDNLKSA